jgi:hypothetical protein
MNVLYLLLSLAGVNGSVEVTTGITLEPVPEDHSVYMQRPAGIEFDANGRFYIVDLAARVIFVWEKDGSFLTHFGKKGEGPGEFSFIGRSGARGFVTVLDDRIYVYDGASSQLHEFTLDYQFVSARILRGIGGRTNYFSMTRDRTILLWQQTSGTEVPTQELSLYDDENLELIKTFYKFEDKTYEAFRKDGQISKYIIHAYAPGITMFCDPAQNEILVGETDKAQFTVFNAKGKKVRTVRFKPLNNDITEDDIEQYNNLPFVRNNPDFYQISFPDKKPFYQVVMPLAGDRYLVYSATVISRDVTGLVLNREGERIGGFHYACGESGGIYGARGRVVAIQTDEEGDFIIQELNFDTGQRH